MVYIVKFGVIQLPKNVDGNRKQKNTDSSKSIFCLFTISVLDVPGTGVHDLAIFTCMLICLCVLVLNVSFLLQFVM